MQDDDSFILSARRRKLLLWAKIVGASGPILLVLAFLENLPDELARRWCPSSSFYVRISDIGWSFGAAVLLGGICFEFLWVLLFTRATSRYWDAFSRREPRRHYFLNTAICVLACGAALSVHLYVRSLSHYYCLSSNEIVVRTRYGDATRIYRWDAVEAVHGYCWTNKPKIAPAFLGGSIDLLLKDGTDLPVDLVPIPGTVSPDYRKIRSSLKGKTYRYYVNATVTPASCPANLYPLLWNWLIDPPGSG